MDIVHFLLGKSESLYFIKDYEGRSNLHVAAEIGNLELCKILAEKIDPFLKS